VAARFREIRVVDGLLGWRRGNMRERYGEGPWIARLAEVMARVSYLGLDLGHLCTR
jgi:hypothetical protein